MKIPVLPLIALSAGLFAGYHVWSSQTPVLQTAPPFEPARSPYPSSIAGVGLVEPRSENIAISPVIPGVVVELLVSRGDQISPGQLLMRLDDRQPRAALLVARAALVQAEKNLQRLRELPRPEEIPPLEARVQEVEAAERKAVADLQREQALFDKQASTAEKLNLARGNREVAAAQTARARADLALLRAGAWGPDLQIAEAQLAAAQAEVERLEVELERHLIRAPLSERAGLDERWEVLQVNTRPGEYVATPASVPAIVLGDTGPRRVRVDFDEYEIAGFDREAAVIASPRGAQGTRYQLSFVQVEPMVIPKRSLTGDNTERVDTRVLQVIYEFRERNVPVFVGQQMDVFLERTSPQESPPGS
jgi:multidrug efflux pump subunit AcrA (membrane-fusion protein)